jgi:hypothetical protein
MCMQVAKAVSHSLNNCVNCLPGQKDVDVALKSIGEASKKLLVDSVRTLSGRGYLVSSCTPPHPQGERVTFLPWSLWASRLSHRNLGFSTIFHFLSG